MTSTHPLLGGLLHDAARLVRKRFELRAAAHGLSSAQWRLLVHVLREGPVSQVQLADLLEVEPISVSRLIDRMQKSGWVTRQPDPNDRRVHHIVATDSTQAIRHELRAMAADVYEEAMAGLDPAARTALLSGLTAINANLSGDHSPASNDVKDPT